MRANGNSGEGRNVNSDPTPKEQAGVSGRGGRRSDVTDGTSFQVAADRNTFGGERSSRARECDEVGSADDVMSSDRPDR